MRSWSQAICQTRPKKRKKMSEVRSIKWSPQLLWGNNHLTLVQFCWFFEGLAFCKENIVQHWSLVSRRQNFLCKNGVLKSRKWRKKTQKHTNHTEQADRTSGNRKTVENWKAFGRPDFQELGFGGTRKDFPAYLFNTRLDSNGKTVYCVDLILISLAFLT